MLVAPRSRFLVSALALVLFAIVFVSFLLLETPGLGIGHFFYVPVLLFAIAGGPWIGAAGGFLATALYALGVFRNPDLPPSDLTFLSTGIRLVTYMMIGAGFGWFAHRTRLSHERLRLLAERDHLTGVANERAFHEALRRRLAARAPFALLIADMDSLKRVNDERGHPEGDRAINTAAQILVAASRPGDEVARVGGDEFAVIADGLDAARAERLAERLEDETCSAGVPMTLGAGVFPRDGHDATTLYRVVDGRLYERKRSGPGRRQRGPSSGTLTLAPPA